MSKKTIPSNAPNAMARTARARLPWARSWASKDYTDAKVQEKMKDEEMVKATKEGVKDAEGKTKMKGFADALSDDEMKALGEARSCVQEVRRRDLRVQTQFKGSR